AACGWCGVNDSSICSDEQLDCRMWASEGECNSNAKYMATSCRKSCGLCGAGGVAVVEASVECTDRHKDCEGWARQGGCTTNSGFMRNECAASCGACYNGCVDRKSNCGETTRPTSSRFFLSFAFDRATTPANMQSIDLPPDICCTNTMRTCVAVSWRDDHQCVRNRRFMAKHCRASCGLCGTEEQQSQQLCTDEDIKCEQWAKGDECRNK
ncbi:MAG: hypothetical protein SGPRY_013468, partial [Prymnesium sp.]